MHSSIVTRLRGPYIALPLAAIGLVLVFWFPSVAVANNQIDLWYNFGMFFNYQDALHWFSDSRQVSRLPVVLPGYVLTHLFGIIGASYTLFFVYYLTTLVFFYHAVKLLITREVAVFATVFLATSAYLIGAYSTTLPATPAIVYDMVSLYFMAVAIDATTHMRTSLAMLASGIAAGLAIHCHLVIVPYAAANYLIYIVYVLFFTADPIAKRVSRIALGGFLAACGIAIITVALGAIIVVVFHGSFLQIFNDVAYVPAAEHSLAKYYNAGWYKNGAEAGMLLAACVAAILNIVAVKREQAFRNRVVAISVAILTLSAVLLADNQRGGVFLQYSSYFTCFLPYLALSIFAPIAIWRDSDGLRYLPYAAAFCIGSLAIVLVRDTTAPWLFEVPGQAKASIACALCIGILYGLVTKWSARKLLTSFAALYLLVILVMAFVSRPDEKVGYYIWADTREQATSQRSQYVRLGRGLTFLSGVRFATYPKFWVDMGRMPETAIYPRAYMEYRYQPFLPKIDYDFCYAPDFCRFKPGDNIIVIDEPTNLPARVESAFSNLHLRVTETAGTQIAYDGVAYEILVEHVVGTTQSLK